MRVVGDFSYSSDESITGCIYLISNLRSNVGRGEVWKLLWRKSLKQYMSRNSGHGDNVITGFRKDLDTCTTEGTATNPQSKQTCFKEKQQSSSCMNVWQCKSPAVLSSLEIENVLERLEQPSRLTNSKQKLSFTLTHVTSLPTAVSVIILLRNK